MDDEVARFKEEYEEKLRKKKEKSEKGNKEKDDEGKDKERSKDKENDIKNEGDKAQDNKEASEVTSFLSLYSTDKLTPQSQDKTETESPTAEDEPRIFELKRFHNP